MTLDLAALDRIEALRQQAPEGPYTAGLPAWFRGRTDPTQGKRPITSGKSGVLANAYGPLADYLAALSPEVVGELVKWARLGMLVDGNARKVEP